LLAITWDIHDMLCYVEQEDNKDLLKSWKKIRNALRANMTCQDPVSFLIAPIAQRPQNLDSADSTNLPEVIMARPEFVTEREDGRVERTAGVDR
jgi:hypothetical protein